jgi:energy-coupling factor transport system ATP-binding protein
MVMQDVNHQLFCETVEEEIQLGMAEEKADKVSDLLRELDLAGFRERHPMSLSGGQKQRVAIASAVLAEKSVLIFDEPTNHLDENARKIVANYLNSKKGFILVSHDRMGYAYC